MKKQISVVESKFCAGIKPIDLRKQISKLSFSVTKLFHFDSEREQQNLINVKNIDLNVSA